MMRISFALCFSAAVMAASSASYSASADKLPKADKIIENTESDTKPVAPGETLSTDDATKSAPVDGVKLDDASSSEITVEPEPELEVTPEIEADADIKVDDEWGEIEDIEKPAEIKVAKKSDDGELSVEWDDDDDKKDGDAEEDKPDVPYSLSGYAAIEVRTFPFGPQFKDQRHTHVSPAFIFAPEFNFKWREGKNRLTFKPYLLLDRDDQNRTHADIRELSFLHQGKGWDILVGVSKVFWGVTESRHLVDIINQSDTVIDGDGEDKLGQPMINLNVESDWGALAMFVLPGHRKRTFADDINRFRGPLSIADDNSTYEANAGKRHIDFAARWSHTIGDWDVGVSHFYGTSREPRFLLGQRFGGQPVLVPRYDLIHQTGVDVQYTSGAWLWKFEGMSRSGHGKRFYAGVGGFEYTKYQIFKTTADLGMLVEFQYDNRKDGVAPGTFNNNDLFIGARVALNDEFDSSALAGVIVDVKNGATLLSVEAERRLGASWKIELEARFSLNIPDRDILSGIRKDDIVTLRLSRYF